MVYRILSVFSVSAVLFHAVAFSCLSIIIATASTVAEQDEVNNDLLKDIPHEEILVNPLNEFHVNTEDAELIEEVDTVPTMIEFTQPLFEGIRTKDVPISFVSTNEINEVSIQLPQPAKIVKDLLPADMEVKEIGVGNNWVIQSETVRTSFSIKLAFEKSGVFEIWIGESSATIEIVPLQDDVLESENDQVFPYEVSSENEDEDISKTESHSSMNYNYLLNPNFNFTSGGDNRIPNWELSSTGIPVNHLNRNLTFSSDVDSEGWHLLSDANFKLKGENNLSISQSPVNRTLIVSQVIQTIPGRHYNLGVKARTNDPGGYIHLVAYSFDLISGPNYSLGNERIDLTDAYENYEISFVATHNRTTFSYRVIGNHIELTDAYVVPLEHSLTMVASPDTGGNPTASRTSMIAGEHAEISANPNNGYRFAHWEIISGEGADVTSTTNLESTFIMGNSNATVKAIYQVEEPGKVYVQYLDTDGHELLETEVLDGVVGDTYETKPKEIEHYQLVVTPDNATGIFQEEIVFVTYVYELVTVPPLDPLDPDKPIDPENKPHLPVDQGLFSIDFVSQFNFGTQVISIGEKKYYAEPQRLLDEGGNVLEGEVRPNFIQISDRRPDNERSRWQFAVTQTGQFSGDEGQQLSGASITFENQQLISSRGNVDSNLQPTSSVTLEPGHRRVLFDIPEGADSGTWFYLFGDEETSNSSVVLDVPKCANPEATSYSTNFLWELSSVPDNR